MRLHNVFRSLVKLPTTLSSWCVGRPNLFAWVAHGLVSWQMWHCLPARLPRRIPPRTQHARFTMPGKATTLSNLIEIDSEDDFARPDEETMLTPDSTIENNATKTRRRPVATSRTASKVTKARAPAKKATSTATARLKRSALLERNNLANASETEEVEDEDDRTRRRRDDEDLVTTKTTKRAKAAKAKAETISTKPRKTTKASRVVEQESEVEEEVLPKPKASRTVSKSSKNTKRAALVEPTKTIPETQQDQTEITEVSMVTQDEEQEDEPTPKPVRKPTAARARSASRQRQTFRRAGSASDTERAGDPALRRKLGDITRQLENMQLKYNNLREIGMKDAESNFDRLKRTTEQRAKGITISPCDYKTFLTKNLP